MTKYDEEKGQIGLYFTENTYGQSSGTVKMFQLRSFSLSYLSKINTGGLSYLNLLV